MRTAQKIPANVRARLTRWNKTDSLTVIGKAVGVDRTTIDRWVKDGGKIDPFRLERLVAVMDEKRVA